MVEPQAQFACFGAIDDAIAHCTPATVAMIEDQLPGVTKAGQRGWYGELQRFVSKYQDALAPVNRIQPASVGLPDLADAVAMVFDEPRDRVLLPDPIDFRARDTRDLIEDGASNASALIRASTVINKIVEMQNGTDVFGPTAADALRFNGDIDPLAMVVNRATALPQDQSVVVANKLRATKSRADVDATLRTMVNDDDQTAVSLRLDDHYTARLRNINGSWSSILTSDWVRPELRLDQYRKFIEPRNWKLLYNFFDDIECNRPLTSNGWTRIVEVVSPDPNKLWMLKTTLRYWKQKTTDDGICINYDLAEVRDPSDSRLVEVDNGYIWITNRIPGKPEKGVRIRASKELRIRGLSPTATAALGIYTGWPDAAAQLLTAQAESPPEGCIDFDPPSPTFEPPPDVDDAEPVGAQPGGSGDTEPAAEVAAEALDLPTGWRESLLENSKDQAAAYLDTVTSLAKGTAKDWSNGIEPDDIARIGNDWGTGLTKFAASMFDQAVNAMRPPAKELPPKEPLPEDEQ